MLHNKTTQTAIAAMSRLSEVYSQPEVKLSSRDIAESRNLPAPIVAKILTELSRAGWVTGAPGPNGGYRLAVDPSTVSLFDISSLFERESDVACPFGPGWCGNGEPCPLHHDLSKMRQQEQTYCENTTFAIFQTAADRKNVAANPRPRKKTRR